MRHFLLLLVLFGRDELADASAKLNEGYAFSLEAKNETIPTREPALTLAGAWTKDSPLQATSGDVEMFRGPSLAWKSKNGAWARFDPKAGVRANEQERHALFTRVLRLRPPHEEIAAVAKALKNAKKGKDGVIEGDLGAEGCIDVVCDGKVTPMPAMQTNHAGRVKAWIEKGAVAKYEIAITWTEKAISHVGESTTVVTWRKTVTLKDVGATKIEVPEAIKKLLE